MKIYYIVNRPDELVQSIDAEGDDFDLSHPEGLRQAAEACARGYAGSYRDNDDFEVDVLVPARFRIAARRPETAYSAEPAS